MSFSIIFILAAILVQSIHISATNKVSDDEKYLQAFGDESAKYTTQQLARFKRQATDSTVTTTVAGATTLPPVTEAPTLPPQTAPPALSAGPGTPGFACSPDLYKNYSRKCCYIPSLIDELQSTKECSKSVKNIQPIAITQFGSRRLFGKRSANYRFQFKQVVQPVRPATPRGVLTLEQICLMDCIFRTERWLTSNGLDVQYMYTVLNQTLPADPTFTLPYLLQSAYFDCSGFINAPSADPALSLNANSTMRGRTCMHGPTKWFRCFRRFLLLYCPQNFQPSPQYLPKSCGMERLTIEKCDIHTL